MPATRPIRRLHKLSEATLDKGEAERQVILKTILKILDECSDAEYDEALAEPLKGKLVTAGVIFDGD